MRVLHLSPVAGVLGHRDEYFLLGIGRFPAVYTSAYMFYPGGWVFCIGLVAAWVLKKQTFAT